jgi:signal transduction histidine kinase
MNLKTKLLECLIKDEILADFFTDKYEESHYGYLIDYNGQFLLFDNYNEDFIYNGVTVIFQQNVSRIRWEGNELESLAKLIDLSKRQKDRLKIDLSSIQSILNGIYQHFKHIALHIQDLDSGVCFIGQIHEMDEESIVLHEYGTKASLDRKFILLSLSDITRIDAGGQYETNLQKLYK